MTPDTGALRKDFGALLGRVQAPSVKTLRRKLSCLASFKKGAQLGLELAKLLVKRKMVEVGILYVDAHFKPYYGKRKVSKGYFTQRRLAHPGAMQYFINDYEGKPLFFMLTEASDSLTKVLPKIIEDIRQVIGKSKFTIIFVRGGFSALLFKLLKGEGIDFITYRRGWKRHYPTAKFKQRRTTFAGKPFKFLIHDTRTRLKSLGLIRTVVVSEDERQVPIITSLEDIQLVSESLPQR